MNFKNFQNLLITRFCLLILFIFFLSYLLIAGGKLYKKITGKTNNFIDSLVYINENAIDAVPVNEPRIIEPVNWSELYPFESNKNELDTLVYGFSKMNNEKISNSKVNIFFKANKVLNYFKNKITGFLFHNVLFKNKIIEIAKFFEKILHWNIVFPDTNNVVEMPNGYLNKFYSEIDVSIISDAVTDFNNFCNELEIPFVYMQAPYKTCKYDSAINNKVDFSNKNADKFIENLKKNNVPFMDFREELHNSNINHYDAFFITDHHWKPEIGLWAAGKIAEMLKFKYKLDVDLEIFDLKNYNYEIIKNNFLGCEGRIVTLTIASPEDMCLITPKDNYDLSHKRYNSKGLLQNEKGGFEILTDKTQIRDADFYFRNPYYYYMIGDNVSFIKNNTVKNNTKILITGDSFTQVVEPFLALGVRQLDCLDLRAFTGSFKKFIKENMPYDCIIMLLHPGYLSEKIDYDSHSDVFDLR